MYEFPWIDLGLLLNGAAIDRVSIVGGMGLYLSQTLNIALQHYYEIKIKRNGSEDQSSL